MSVMCSLSYLLWIFSVKILQFLVLEMIRKWSRIAAGSLISIFIVYSLVVYALNGKENMKSFSAGWLNHSFVGGEEFEKETFAELNREIQRTKKENVHLRQQIRKLEHSFVRNAPVAPKSDPVKPCAKVTHLWIVDNHCVKVFKYFFLWFL